MTVRRPQELAKRYRQVCAEAGADLKEEPDEAAGMRM